jgi:hypothetical protein
VNVWLVGVKWFVVVVLDTGGSTGFLIRLDSIGSFYSYVLPY